MTGPMELHSLLKNQISCAFFECCDPHFAASILASDVFGVVLEQAMDDVVAFAAKDPAAHGDPVLIAQTYTSFKAVLHYRIAHALIVAAGTSSDMHDLKLHAAIIANRGKLLSGAEIHPSCRIGKRFVLDHGFGTVIGETAELGDDCYVLGGVTLGAAGISANPSMKRHPTIGNRVQIGAFARIFGTASVGDDVFIGPHCVIKEDVPADSIVTLKTECQVMRERTPCDSRRSLGAGPELAASIAGGGRSMHYGVET